MVRRAVAFASYEGSELSATVELIAGIQKQLCVLDLSGGVDVAPADEDGIVIHSVNLDRDAIRPAATDWQARVEEQGSVGSGPCLCKLLCGQQTEREPSVDEFGRQFVGEMIGFSVMTNRDEPVVLQEVVHADRPLASM